MSKRIQRIVFIILIVALVSVLLLWPKSPSIIASEKLKIISTNFASYDIARALTKNIDTELTMLIKPGTDVHSYDPTPQDIIQVQNANIFIYTGGESESWVENIQIKTQSIKLADAVTLIDEPNENIIQDEREHEHEYKQAEKDEHIWTSPKNYLTMLSYAKDQMIKSFPNHAETIEQNYTNYANKLKQADQDFRTISPTKPLIFADRFPLAYFVQEYGYEYLAALPGCAEQTEADAGTIAELTDVIKEQKITTIYTIELSNAKIANTISTSTGAKIRTLQSGHNITQHDFENGLTMVDVYRNNYATLQEAE